MSDGQRSSATSNDGASGSAHPARPIPALRGAIAFLTRIPVPGGQPSDWQAFTRSPWTYPVVGAVVGCIAGLAFLVPSPWTAAAVYLLVVYLVCGVTHADGLADLADAIAVHDPDRRVEVLKDSTLGVGGGVALGITLLVTALGALALATGFVGGGGGGGGGIVGTGGGIGSAGGGIGSAGGGIATGSVAFRIVIAAEVGAKTGMALLACFGSAAHEGFGSSVMEGVGPVSFVPVALVAATVLLTPPPGAFTALLAALLAGPMVALVLLYRVRPWLGGINGDVLGATNELGRAVGLHLGVIAWVVL